MRRSKGAGFGGVSFDHYLKLVLAASAKERDISLEERVAEVKEDPMVFSLYQEGYEEIKKKLPLHKRIRVLFERHSQQDKERVMHALNLSDKGFHPDTLRWIAEDLEEWVKNRGNRSPTDDFGRDLVIELCGLVKYHCQEDSGVHANFLRNLQDRPVKQSNTLDGPVFKRLRRDSQDACLKSPPKKGS